MYYLPFLLLLIESCVFNSLVYVLITLVVILLLHFDLFISFYYLKSFSNSVKCLLITIIVSFDVQKLFQLINHTCLSFLATIF
jgi:hypothetical protein